MFENELHTVVDILESFLSDSRRGVNYDGWTEYNCPYCASNDGVESDGKYNLCINYGNGAFHCWKCQEKGRLSKLIKDYGGDTLLTKYRNELQSIRNSSLYKFRPFGKILNDDELLKYENFVSLPKGFKKIDKNSLKCRGAYEYLIKRGVTDDMINKYNIGYIGWSEDFKYRNRIIIPSYDGYGDVNYWVGRDYSGKSKLKYCNPNIEKKLFVFNEKLIDWYDNVTLVEGVFDHIVVPNSIPLLGKTIDYDYATFKAITENAMANINILLDDDAFDDAIKMYKFLDNGVLKGRIRLIVCPDGYDASLINEKEGKDGIIKLLKSAKKLNELDLICA